MYVWQLSVWSVLWQTELCPEIRVYLSHQRKGRQGRYWLRLMRTHDPKNNLSFKVWFYCLKILLKILSFRPNIKIGLFDVGRRPTKKSAAGLFFWHVRKKFFFLLFFRILGTHVRFLLRPTLELCDVSIPWQEVPCYRIWK